MFPVICFAAGTRGVAGDGEKQYGGDSTEANTRVNEPCGDRAVYEQKMSQIRHLINVFLNAIMAPPFIVDYDCICFSSIIIR